MPDTHISASGTAELGVPREYLGSTSTVSETVLLPLGSRWSPLFIMPLLVEAGAQQCGAVRELNLTVANSFCSSGFFLSPIYFSASTFWVGLPWGEWSIFLGKAPMRAPYICSPIADQPFISHMNALYYISLCSGSKSCNGLVAGIWFTLLMCVETFRKS